MLKKFAIGATLLVLSGLLNVSADVLQIRDDAPASYVVKKGDTLWDISALYLNEPWLWPQLWQMNPQIDNPHLIYPGDTLTLVYDAQGKPRLVVNENVKRLSPTARKTMKGTDAVTTLPLSMIRHYLTFEQALDEERIAALPYVLGSNANVKNSVNDHIIYAKGVLDTGASYGVYRKGKPYFDPETETVLGYETTLVATARAFRAGREATEESPAEASSLNVLSVKREIKQGDRLMPALEGQALPAFFTMRKPDYPVDGLIIDTTSNLREFSKWDIVVLNRGELQNMEAGFMLGIYRNSPLVVDGKDGPVYIEDANKLQQTFKNFGENTIQLPREKVGELMVFKVSERSSFAIVTKTQRPIRVGDLISNL
ncbi:MAG: LysM peptidoglycan-binding domain-containing protein [Gammaproteobacteria bacterium]|nr:LysM peptidoglycan-binding domain-containing protein [Gammaproteobacteria bacterium]MBU1553435.1 LysM peptidoglycan-binding domain-containing protein [Gammaproteobacteria bacterium]MBU2072398.1 LysM peptidoglycan-binding domain-containing protein [Gammaproteobacteria bacterium]MBU2183348.1 LysM peptidoglycan-binding domain-containing protein [Gammaproteobacteria bacterium]MBU2203135.1 LysM peptidoglycan-binding domain-containing protein [Gammaproteobacteria bacterium]